VTIAPPIEQETEVVRRAQAGDRAAFGELYDAYLNRIFDFALGMLRNRADAEDVTSDTFLKAVEQLAQLKDPAAFKGWLYTIARNCALRVVEARKRSVPVDDHAEDATAMDAAPLPVVGDRAEFDEMRELFDAAASTLSEKERTVYELAVRHGMGSAEIGRVLGVRPAYAYILVNRLKGSVTEAAEAVALSRVGGGSCGALAQLLGTVDPVSSRGRKAIARHARSCEICEETKRKRASLPAMMQGVAFAEPGHEFRRELSHRIDGAWGTGGGALAAGAGMAAIVASVAAVLIVSVGIVAGAAQRTLTRHEAPRPAVRSAVETPSPTAQPTDQPTVDEAPPVAPPTTPGTAVVIVTDSGDSGVTTGSSSSSNGWSTEAPHTFPPRQTQPPVG